MPIMLTNHTDPTATKGAVVPIEPIANNHYQHIPVGPTELADRTESTVSNPENDPDNDPENDPENDPNPIAVIQQPYQDHLILDQTSHPTLHPTLLIRLHQPSKTS
jgi:hypothetical protein